MDNANVISILSKLNNANVEQTEPEHISLRLVSLSKTVIALTDEINSIIDDINSITGQAVIEILEEIQNDPSDENTDFLQVLNPQVLELCEMAKARLDRDEEGENA